MLSSSQMRNSAPMCLSTDTNTTNESGDFEYLCSVQTYIDAFYHCRKNSLWKASTQRFEKDLLASALDIANTVKQNEYYPRPYQEFNLCERGKLRHIKAPVIRDRVFCHALCHGILLPRIKPYLIYDNSAALKGKGISFARKRILAHLHRYYREHGNKGYILQTDFSKFFDTINHKLLCGVLHKHTSANEVRIIITRIVDSFGKVGLGIGSELSQIAGILFPTPIDNFCKTVKACKYYARYMDDIYVIHHDKEFLKSLFKDMQAIAEHLQLRFNPKKCHINRLDHYFTFLKSIYHLTKTGKVIYKPSKACLKRERLKLKRFVRLVGIGKLKLTDVQNAYKAWRGNILRQYPNTSRSIINKFDNYFKQLFGVFA